MAIIIRKPKLEPTMQGIPKDFYDIMTYFNQALFKKIYPYIPRKSVITHNEIKKLWLPSLDKNISYVAEQNNTIIGSATCFFDTSSTAYKQADQRKPGEIGLTVNPSYNHKEIGTLLLTELIKELKTQKKSALFHTCIQWEEEIKMIEELGFKAMIIAGYKRYKDAGIPDIVAEYNLP